MPLIIRAKLWRDGTTEPGWQIEYTDADPLTGVSCGLWNYRGSSVGSPVASIHFDDYMLHNTRGRLLASDSFSRESASGWGSAEAGGTWTLTGGLPGKATVSGGRGAFALAPGGGGTAYLNSVPTATSRSRVTFSPEFGPENGAFYVGLESRVTGTSGYRGSAFMRPNGSVWVLIQRTGETAGYFVLPSTTWAAGQTWHLRSETVDPDERTPFAWIGQRAITRALISGQEVKP